MVAGQGVGEGAWAGGRLPLLDLAALGIEAREEAPGVVHVPDAAISGESDPAPARARIGEPVLGERQAEARLQRTCAPCKERGLCSLARAPPKEVS